MMVNRTSKLGKDRRQQQECKGEMRGNAITSFWGELHLVRNDVFGECENAIRLYNDL
jgi:hypothetical protein